jgi:hypothetical protein
MGIDMETIVIPATEKKEETTANIIVLGELGQIIVYNYLHMLYNKKLRMKFWENDDEEK